MEISVKSNKEAWDAFGVSVSGSGFEVGMIIGWAKPVSEIPPGWALVDGLNGTPNPKKLTFIMRVA